MKHSFNFDTINDFDNHISKSILGYDVLHSLIINISSFFIKKNIVPIDLGCTSGKLISAIQKTYNCNCIGYDITDHSFISGIDLRKQDITDVSFKIPKTNLVYLIFTLQFIDYSKRTPILKNIFEALEKKWSFDILRERNMLKWDYSRSVYIF